MLASSFLLFVSSALAASKCSMTTDLSQQYCLYGSPDPSTPGNVLITVHSSAKPSGWAAFGKILLNEGGGVACKYILTCSYLF